MYREFLPWHVRYPTTTIKDRSLLAHDGVRFCILNWNVHKNNHKYQWLNDFKMILDRYNPNLITFQEYKKISKRSIIDKDERYGYGYLPNIIFNKSSSGLLNASTMKMDKYKAKLTHSLEPIIKTPKPSFLSTYKLSDNSTLGVINIHMINFVKLKKFKEQLDIIYQIASSCDDRLLVVGDFNTWSKKRYKLLERLTMRLDLKRVDFGKSSPKLDHIFYRGVELESTLVLKDFKSSDHKPMVAVFKLV